MEQIPCIRSCFDVFIGNKTSQFESTGSARPGDNWKLQHSDWCQNQFRSSKHF